MKPQPNRANGWHQVPQTLIRALFRYPWALQSALDDAGLAPHDLAIWARQSGNAPDIEKLAGWLAVGRRPGYYKPLLEVAGSHLRADDLWEALPVFRWAYRAWETRPNARATRRYDVVKLLGLWGECLYRLGHRAKARTKWLQALDLDPDERSFKRLARIIEKADGGPTYEAVLDEARRRQLPGADGLWQRWQRIKLIAGQVSSADGAFNGQDAPDGSPPPLASSASVAVMADVANLDLVCADQYGIHRRLDYGRLLKRTERHGPVRVKIAFVPDVPDTLPVREHLIRAGFDLDLKHPKRSHGRIVANADTAMAACAVRWASDPDVGRVELWTGDGDFVKVRTVVAQVWPQVSVVFRSFELGTAAMIRRLGEDWQPIGVECLQAGRGEGTS